MRKLYRIHEFAQRVGRVTSTIRRWEREGKLQSKRLLSGHRYFDEADVDRVLGNPPKKRLTVVYCPGIPCGIKGRFGITSRGDGNLLPSFRDCSG